MIKEATIGTMGLRVYETGEETGRAAAAEAAAVIRRLLLEQETVNVIFAAAPSQNEVLSALAGADLDFRRIRAFHMDEYIGLPQGAPQRFGRYLDDHIFGKASFLEVHYLGASEDAEEECRRYAALLLRYPPDVTLLGIGENGHIAFNDPHAADFDDPLLVKVVELDERCRRQQVNDGCFSELDQVPKQAVTLTIPALMSAKAAVCTVPGPTKRAAVTRTVRGEISPDCPATVMRRTEGCVLFCDRESAADII